MVIALCIELNPQLNPQSLHPHPVDLQPEWHYLKQDTGVLLYKSVVRAWPLATCLATSLVLAWPAPPQLALPTGLAGTVTFVVHEACFMVSQQPLPSCHAALS